MTDKKITIKDVAERCGVSVATVSRALNDNYFVTSHLKTKVLQAVDDLGYIPNSIARNLKMNTSDFIGYITSDISNSYHIMMAKAIEDVIKPYNYNLIVCSTDNNLEVEQRYLKLLLGKSIDALVLNTSGKNDQFILNINKSLPMVLVNRRINTPGFHGDFADCNNNLGIYLLTKELLSKGHRKILFVEGPPHLSNTRERFIGFQMAMGEVGIDVTADYPYRFEGDYSLQSGYNAVMFMINQSIEPTAILTTNNTMTIGVLKALKEKQIPIPDQISLAGFNGIDNMELMEIQPTVANFDPYKIGLAAGKAILERIQDNTIENREYIFSPTMIHGNSIRNV